MKKKLQPDELDLLMLEEIEFELGGDIAERFSLQYRKGDGSLWAQKERGLIWSGLHEFGKALVDEAGKAERKRFVATMKHGPSYEQFGTECRCYFRMVVRILAFGSSIRFLPEEARQPRQLRTLDISTIKSLARAWLAMGHGPFLRALQSFAKRWSDERPSHVQNTLILQACASARRAKNQHAATAQLLAKEI